MDKWQSGFGLPSVHGWTIDCGVKFEPPLFKCISCSVLGKLNSHLVSLAVKANGVFI